ncbi:hypothetical protein PGT21_021725 [Puccinia graminis f. sp. tritici]|uniref:CxC1-like cysteine cluster associated with KDZ transposases domain-containing protein n=1 Tax=Puccinia graminis f. sp. tritici TaxID=56615 RepID=A0A5B0QB87_PUCGR|nr:hypothetical protein PGT21_021725 [Puccinia graminis f. sp. tritici]
MTSTQVRLNPTSNWLRLPLQNPPSSKRISRPYDNDIMTPRTPGHRIVGTMSTATTRRPRAPRQNEREIAAEERIRRNVQSGRRLGHIPEAPIPPDLPATNHDIANWIDVENEPTDQPPIEENQQDQWEDEDPILAHASYHQMRRYTERREAISAQWAQLEVSATSAFFQCQYQTLNWTRTPTSFDEPIQSCTCLPNQIEKRNVDLIDLLYYRAHEAIPFCKCMPDVVRLIHYGFFASSADKPRTAFSIRLIQFHHNLWQSAVISSSAFVKAISTFLDSRSSRMLFARGNKFRKRNLLVPFSFSADLFSRILVREKKILNDGLELSKAELWANKCPRCFGPSLHEVKSNPNEPDVIIAMDGNFQQRHYSHASKDVPSEDQYPVDFIPPSALNTDVEAVESTEAEAIGIDPPCSDSHKAANDTRSGTSWEKCDDNGVFASACRHDVPLLFANIFQTGEKLYYPVSIIRNILADFPAHKFGILYDLGCHLESHVRKRGLLNNRIGDLVFGTSVFHAFVHEWSCQVKYNPRLNSWWGLSDGEGLERLWSFLSPLVSSLRVST